MAYREDLTFDEAARSMQVVARTLLREIFAGEELYKDLLDAQNGATVLAWARALYDKPDTGNGTLTVTDNLDGTATITCLTGAGLFNGHEVGADVQFTNFTNAGNNLTTEIIAKASSDSIKITNASLVEETDNNARGQQNPTQAEQDAVSALIATAQACHQLYDDLIGNTPTTADKADLLRNFA